MASAYTTWQKVLDIYPNAADIESNSSNQTALIQAKSDEFASYIRNIHKDVLTSPYDEVVKVCVANLVIEELRHRRLSQDSELETGEFDHIVGRFTHNGLVAHGIIQAIRRGTIVLDEDNADKDIRKPEAVIVTKTGTGTLEVVMPEAYRSWQTDIYRVLITTTGRVDAGTAQYSVWQNYDTSNVLTGQVVSTAPVHLYGGLYLSFKDAATTGNSFVANDEWIIKAIPLDGEFQSAGPREIQWFPG